MFNPKRIHFLYLLVDLVLIFLALFTPYFLRYNQTPIKDLNFKTLGFPNVKEYIFVFILWAFLIVSNLKRRGQYASDRSLTIPRETYIIATSLLYVSTVVGALIFFANFIFFSRLIFITSFGIIVILLTGWRIVKRLILRSLVAKGYHNFNILIVGANNTTALIIEEINARPFLGFRVKGIIAGHSSKRDFGIPLLGAIDDFERICRNHFIDEVMVTESSNAKLVSEIAARAKNMHIGLRVIPFNFEEAPCAITINYLGMLPLLTYKERTISPAELFIKRFIDITASFFLLIICLPVFLLIAVIIKIDNPGPIFYIQKRKGYKGNIFAFYKFRSMVKEADSLKDALKDKNEVRDCIIFKIRNDPRITRIGKFLRKYSLDELPQLINVLKGDMSLVGPRPFPVDESEKFDYTHMPRLNIRPGLTGLAQIRGRSNLSFYRWVKWDLWYVNNWSLWLDFIILVRTLPVVFKGKGAY